MSVDPSGAAPLACAKAGVINKGTGSEKPAELRAGAARPVYIPGRAAKAMRYARFPLRRSHGCRNLAPQGRHRAGIVEMFALMKLKGRCATLCEHGVAA